MPNDLGAYVLGRSSWGRVGLIVATAIMVEMNGETEHPYGPKGKYEAPIAPQASRLAKEGAEAKRFNELSKALHRRMPGADMDGWG